MIPPVGGIFALPPVVGLSPNRRGVLIFGKVILSDFVLRKAKRACAMRRATSGAALKMVCSRPEDASWCILLRLDGYGGQEQDCPRGAAAEFKKKNELDRRMDRGARLWVNQGEAEGVYDCTPMRDNLSSYVCKKIVKKVDNQQKMIQKGVLLSCSYSRSTMLLP